MAKLKVFKEAVCTFLGREWTVTEKVLLIADCVLFGAILGIIFAPRKGTFALGSYNSNYSGADYDEEGWIDEED